MIDTPPVTVTAPVGALGEAEPEQCNRPLVASEPPGIDPDHRSRPGSEHATRRRGARLTQWVAGKLDRDRVYRLGLAGADAVAALCAITGSVIAQDPRDALPMLATVPLIIFISKLAGGYERDELGFGHSTLDEAPELCQVATMFSLIAWLEYGMLGASNTHIEALPALWLSLIVLELVLRCVARIVFRSVVAPERCLLVGDAYNCDWLQARLSRQTSGQLVVAGRLEPTRFTVHALAAYGRVDRVIVAPGRNDGGVSELVRSCRTAGVKVSIVPRVLEAVGCASVRLTDVEAVTLLTMAPARFSSFSRAAKRFMDIVGASLMLVLLAPLGVVIAVAIAGTLRVVSSSANPGSGVAARAFGSSSSARWSRTQTVRSISYAISTRRTACSRSPRTPGSRVSGASCAARHLTRCPNCSMSLLVT